MVMASWIGNALVLYAMYLIGQKRRSGWLYSIAGNAAWCTYAVADGLPSVLFIDGIALLLAVRYYFLWGSNDAK